MLIGVDWGTTNVRAWLMDGSGTIVAHTRSEEGMMRVADGAYPATLARILAPFDNHEGAGEAPILLSGMVGSRQGWHEAPYASCPCHLGDLAAAALLVPDMDRDVAIVPGVAVGMEGGAFADVMRGEETQVFGALHLMGRTAATLVLPGTHAKWVRVDSGAITDFRTFMTGDVYAAVGGHTILAKTLGTDSGNPGAFARGLDAAAGLVAPGDLLARLFSVRSEGLFDRLPPNDAASFLSGLLIGAEVRGAASNAESVIIVGGAALTERYETAMAHFAIPTERAPEDSTAKGQFLVAQARTDG